jgi:hypothetical protein
MVKNSAKKCIISKIVKQISGTITAARRAKGQLCGPSPLKSTFLRAKDRVLKKINSFAGRKAGHYFAGKVNYVRGQLFLLCGSTPIPISTHHDESTL